MNNKIIKSDLAEKILSKVKSNKIKMRPKMYFVVKTILILISIFLIVSLVLFLVSLTTFLARTSGTLYLPGFGFPGIKPFLLLFPWFLILISIVLIVFLEFLVKKFSIAYRRPILYSFLAIAIIALLGSSIIGRTQLHHDFFRRANEGRLPIAGPIYHHYGTPRFEDFHKGMVISSTEEIIVIETDQGENLTIEILPNTKMSPGSIVEEDIIMILGKREDGTVKALEIREIPSNAKPPRDINFLPPKFEARIMK